MNCYVYKGDKKADHYLYLPDEFNASSPPEKLPSAVLALMGELSFVVEFELTAERKMPQADAEHVLASLSTEGFYLQMPKKDMKAEEDEYFGS